MERLLDSGLRCCKNDCCMCRLQGVKMHIATSLQRPGDQTTWLVLGTGSELGLL